MTKPKVYDLFLSSSNEVKANAVETVMRSSGWVPKAETTSYKDNSEQDTDRQPVKGHKKNKAALRQKSWIAWPKV
mgnify:FL=1